MVLTVAHCVHTLNASNVFIRGGTLDPFRGGVVKDILQIDVHPEFNKTKNEHENDVAVLHLDSNLEFNEKIGAIRLADYTDESLYHDYSLKVNISGFGICDESNDTCKLQWIESPILNWTVCELDYAEGVVTEDMFCFLNTTGSYTMEGDCGGCVFYKNGESDPVCLAIFSFGDDSIEQPWPQVGIRIDKYNDWIRSRFPKVMDNEIMKKKPTIP